MNAILAERIAQAEAEITERKLSEEELVRVRRELKVLVNRNLVSAAATSSSIVSNNDTAEVRELKKYNDDLSVSRLHMVIAALPNY